MIRREDVKVVNITNDAFGNDFLEELAATLKEGNGAIGFGEAIVRFGQFWDDNDKHIRPQVVSKGDRGIE